MRSNNWKRFAFFHEIMHRYNNCYLKLIRKYTMKQIFFVWICRKDESRIHWRLIFEFIWWYHWRFANVSNFLFIITILLIEFICNLIVKNLQNVSTKWKKWKMIEKSIKKIMHRMRETCIDTKCVNSNFSDLIKFCRKNKSINMRKNQIFSTLIVFFWSNFCFAKFKCNDCIIRFFETILFVIA